MTVKVKINVSKMAPAVRVAPANSFVVVVTKDNILTALGFTPISGIDKQDVEDALGFTPLESIDEECIVKALGYTPAKASLFIEDTAYPGCYYRMVGTEKEWLNPPLEIGVEYLLAEKNEDGTARYARKIDIGNLPNATNKTIATGINGSKAVSIEPIIYMASGGITPYPFVDANGASMVRIYLGTNGTLYVSSFSDVSGAMGKVIIKYTK